MHVPLPRRLLAASILGLAAVAALQGTAQGQTPTESSVEVRSQLMFRVPDATAQRLLPAGWQLNPATTGPAHGANLLIVLTDRLLTQDTEGRPVPGGVGQAVVLVVPGRNPATGIAGPVIVGGFATGEGAPGPYGTYAPAAITHERAVTAGPDGVRRGQERWSATTPEGDRFELRMRYAVGTPSRTTPQQRVSSGRNPDFHRIYQVDQGTVVLRAAGTDHIEEFAFAASGPRLGPIFDGSEQLTAVLSLPWYLRRVSLP
ncbi:hypothetical protein [Falsiroseomonas oryzae]|uniref:hypothetical protein n=1 Tax=Falsiroseomonas oryzae TaxID=2766473 RepID=UPI0022EAB0CE|nr:hypothetical protein [Roseomonas sp. MO-31]